MAGKATAYTGAFRLAACLAVAAALGLLAVPAGATSLNLQEGPPDITVTDIGVTYSNTTGLFLANGFPTTLDLDGKAPPDYSFSAGAFGIQMHMTPSGGSSPAAP